MKWSCPKCKWVHYYRDIFTKRDKIRINNHLAEEHELMVKKNEIVALKNKKRKKIR